MNILILDVKFRNLERDILADVSYIYNIFLSKDIAEDELTTFKSRISPFDRKFIDFGGSQLKKLSESSFITPYNTLEAMVTDRVIEAFSDIQLPEQMQIELNQYGERADVIRQQFQEDISRFIQNTVKGRLCCSIYLICSLDNSSDTWYYGNIRITVMLLTGL